MTGEAVDGGARQSRSQLRGDGGGWPGVTQDNAEGGRDSYRDFFADVEAVVVRPAVWHC